MARILTGVQSTNIPHLGNILGAMQPAVELSQDPNNEAFLFIADLHSLTAVRDAEFLRNNTYAVASAYLALGFDIENNVFYRQSKVPEVTELTWYLNCFMSYSRLQLATSFKDKSDRLQDVNAGLFTYPVLMAADILLYDAEVVPVGKDQKQHLEITRSLAERINHLYGSGEANSILVVPEISHRESTMMVPGTDGQKMSKSYGNFIDVLSTTDKQLKKQVNGIVSDSTPLEEPKDPNHTVVQLYELVASEEEVAAMKEKLLAGGYGWGHAKGDLYQALLRQFGEVREKYQHFMENKDEVDAKLAVGEAKAREIAAQTLDRVRSVLGY